MGILKPPELTTWVRILTIPPAQLTDYDLLSPSLPFSIKSLSSHFYSFSLLPSSSSWGAFHCLSWWHNLTQPSISVFLLAALSNSVCLILPDTFVDGERMPFLLSLSKAPSLPLSHFSMLAQPIQPSHCGSWSLFSSPHLLWVTMLRLGCRCHFASQCFFIVLDPLPPPLCLSPLSLCCFGLCSLYCWPLTLKCHLG